MMNKYNIATTRKISPVISVIIPVYNAEKYLAECLDSVLGQTYTNLEIILVNDGSTDKSGMICNEYQKQDRRIKTIHVANGGASYARNQGLRIAKGDFLLFVDADDTIHQNLCELGINAIFNYHVDWVMWNITRQYNKPFKEGLYQAEQYADLLKHSFIDKGFGPSLSCHLFKREIFKQGNISFPHILKNYEDLAVVLQYAMKAKSIFFIDSFLYFYRANPISTTHLYDVNCSQNIINEIRYFSDLCVSACPQALPYWHQKELFYLYKRVAEETKDKNKSFKQKCNNLVEFFNKPIIQNILSHTDISYVNMRIFITFYLIRTHQIRMAYLWVLGIQKAKYFLLKIRGNA